MPDADKHFDKIGPADAQERNIRFSGNGAGEQGLSRTGLPHQEQSLGDSPSQSVYFLGSRRKSITS